MIVRVSAPAKINLTLAVTGKRADGYHLLCSVMQSVDWYDTVTVALSDTPGISLSCDGGIPADTANTAYRAAALFQEATGLAAGCTVTIGKSIPAKAGLGGGSTDAAAVLVALNTLTGETVNIRRLCELGARVGADVPFCVQGGTVLCTGIGEKLTPVAPLPDCHVVVACPMGGVSTPEAYRLLDTTSSLLVPDTAGLCRCLTAGDLYGAAACIGNAFEAPLSLTDTDPIRQVMHTCGALASSLSGSGSAVFGLFDTAAAASACVQALLPTYSRIRLCRPCCGQKLEKLV